jgi:hypothetical protein
LYSLYGINNLIMRYSGLDNSFYYPFQAEHGWYGRNAILPTDYNKKRGVNLVVNKRRKNIWGLAGVPNVEIIGPPLSLYIKLNPQILDRKKEGVIYLAPHSTKQIDVNYSVNKICESLRELHNNFSPVTIMLHYFDRNLAPLYELNGFKSVTAGNIYSNSFPGKFFEILSSYEYCASSHFGTHALHAFDLGIPFFTIPLEGVVYRGNDKNTDSTGEVRFLQDSVNLVELFQGPLIKNSLEQKLFFIDESSHGHIISSEELREKILYSREGELSSFSGIGPTCLGVASSINSTIKFLTYK